MKLLERVHAAGMRRSSRLGRTAQYNRTKEAIPMIKIELDEKIVKQIRTGEGPIELVDGSGRTIGVVRRPPTVAEIARAKDRRSHGGQTLTREQLIAKVRAETGH